MQKKRFLVYGRVSAWLHHGPRTAKVTQVFVEDYLSEREFTEFQVLH